MKITIIAVDGVALTVEGFTSKESAENDNPLLFDQEVMKTQHDLGIDVITDGEMDRGAYYIHIMNNIKVCLNLQP